MATLATASLSPKERRVLGRLVELLETEFGADLRGVWFYGSRARGEPPREYSDVDLLVVSSRGRLGDDRRVINLVFDAAEAEGLNLMTFSTKLYDPELIEQRRSIRSFFIQEVDREKIVLFGEP